MYLPLLQHCLGEYSSVNCIIVRSYIQRQNEKDQLVSKLKHVKSLYKDKTQNLIHSFYQLENCIEKVDQHLLKSSSCSKCYIEKVNIKQLILYSHRISGTVAAPSGWNYTSQLPLAFRPPAPQEHEMRLTTLFYDDKRERVPKPVINVDPLNDFHRVSITCSRTDAIIRYTLDMSLPSALTGKLYERPFDVPSETDFIVRAVAIIPGMQDSELVEKSVRDIAFVMPAPVDHVAERPVHMIASTSPLDLALDLSPPRASSDEEWDFNSPYITSL